MKYTDMYMYMYMLTCCMHIDMHMSCLVENLENVWRDVQGPGVNVHIVMCKE